MLMKTLLVKLDIGKPLSINNKMIPSRGRLVKAKNYRIYEEKLDKELAKYFDHFRVLGNNYSGDRHALEVKWSIYVPQSEFFTKKKTISKTCIDATNCVKIMEDRLAKILGVDDSQICESSVKKIPTNSNSWCVVLELSLVPYPLVVPLNDEKWLPVF